MLIRPLNLLLARIVFGTHERNDLVDIGFCLAELGQGYLPRLAQGLFSKTLAQQVTNVFGITGQQLQGVRQAALAVAVGKRGQGSEVLQPTGFIGGVFLPRTM